LRLLCALINDDKDRDTGQTVAGFISEGLAVERVTWDDYTTRVCKEPTFLRCPHGQLALFDAQGTQADGSLVYQPLLGPGERGFVKAEEN